MNEKQTTPVGMKEQATKCEATVKSMGATLPKYMQNLFAQMKDAGRYGSQGEVSKPKPWTVRRCSAAM